MSMHSALDQESGMGLLATYIPALSKASETRRLLLA